MRRRAGARGLCPKGASLAGRIPARGGARDAPSGADILLLVLAVAALSAAALAKPPLWDDVVYLDLARALRDHPADPYGGTIRLLGRDEPAMAVLAPPVLLYWAAGASALLGTRAAALGLVPFAAILVWAVHALARRFAPSCAAPLAIAAVLSPWAPVTIGWMLDLPALALGLAALVLFIRGCDGGRPAARAGLIAAAGLVAGLAMQTKYNAAAAPAAMLLYGLTQRRPAPALVAAALAGAVFAGWEALLWLRAGQSHFLAHLDAPGGASGRLPALAYGLVANAGPLALPVLLLAPQALGLARAQACALQGAAVLAFALALLGWDDAVPTLLAWPSSAPTLLTLAGLLGIAVVALASWLALAALRQPLAAARRDAWFLVGWIDLELAVYFAMSPFPAARRHGALVVATLLLCGHLLAARSASAAPRLALPAGLGALAGLAMLAIVLVDAANVERTAAAARAAVADLALADGPPAAAAAGAEPGPGAWQLVGPGFDWWLRGPGPGPRLRPVERGRSVLRAGDLVVLDAPGEAARLGLAAARLAPVAVVRAGRNLGITVSTDFYRNRRPWTAAADTRPSLAILRVGATMRAE